MQGQHRDPLALLKEATISQLKTRTTSVDVKHKQKAIYFGSVKFALDQKTGTFHSIPNLSLDPVRIQTDRRLEAALQHRSAVALHPERDQQVELPHLCDEKPGDPLAGWQNDPAGDHGRSEGNLGLFHWEDRVVESD